MNQSQKSHQPIDKDQKSTHASTQTGHGAKPAAKGLAHEHQDGQRSIKPKAESSLVREREPAHKA